MTTRAKVIGVGLLFLFVWFITLDDDPTVIAALDPPAPGDAGEGTVTASNLVVENGGCVRVDFYSTGKSKATGVDASQCCDYYPNFAPCAQSGGTSDSSGVDAFPFSLPPKE